MRRFCELFVAVSTLLLCMNTSPTRQNQAPKFEPPLLSNYFFHEYNLTKPGEILLWLNATDLDDDDLEFGVENGFYRKLLTVNKVDNKHATVVTNEIFDRETQEKYENIVFYVKDKPGNKVYQSVRFVILDVDDNAPEFKRTPYRVSVSESTPPGTLIFDSIEAVDLDGPLYNKFEFQLSERDTQLGLFAIDKTQFRASGHYSTSIVLKRRLNYEQSKSHVVTIMAVSKSGEMRASTELVVNVLDAPDRTPEFTQSPYYVKLEEELPIGEFVVQVQAKDGDSGINNPCRYEIVNDGMPAVNYFSIDSRTGVISVRQRIDLESAEVGSRLGGLLEFSVRAIEVGDENATSSTSRVIVSVSDINDNEPVFNKRSFRLNLLPSQTNAGSTLTLIDLDIDSIRVYDPDKGVNGSMSLYMFKVLNNDSYDDSVDFEIIPRLVLNEGNLIVKVKGDFNVTNKIGSIQHYHLIAKDNGIDGQAVRADLFVKIEYTNQYAPQFALKSYLLRIDENAPFNSTVGYLNAYDNDTYGDFGRISYELKNGQNRFQIEKSTGRVYTISRQAEIELDRESIDTYYMNVEATDGGGLRTSVQLVVKLDDVNDNRPQFISNLFPSPSSSSSSSSLLMLLPSSSVETPIGLSRSSNDQHHIKNNDNLPTLIGFIEENTDKWFEPIRLQAIDRDLGLNGLVEYEIDETETPNDPFVAYFRINNVTKCVELKPNRTLDYEEIVHVKKSRSGSISNMTFGMLLNPGEVSIDLVVVARDLGRPSLSSKINARVIVKDVNDNKPIFDKMYYSAQVYETANIGEIIRVKAIDADAPGTANSKIIYSIESGNKDKFSIDSTSGVLRINENTNLDRDLFGSFYTLKIAATDFGSISNSQSTTTKRTSYSTIGDVVDNSTSSSTVTLPSSLVTNSSSSTSSGESFCFVTIKVLDVNNKSPKFSTYPEVITIPESAAPGTRLVRMEAVDSDFNANLVYFLPRNVSNRIRAFDENNNAVNVELLADWFAIDPKSGDLLTHSRLDRELAEHVYLTVDVEDLNADEHFRPQIATAVVKIRLLDVNDNHPMFPSFRLVNVNFSSIGDESEEPIYEVFDRIEENTKINTRLGTQLRAIDLDKYANITYMIVHSTDPTRRLLAIDKLNGHIYVNGLIDYETTKWINLTILVADNTEVHSKAKHSLVHFYCQVLDLNDNAPKFFQLNTTEFRIHENNPPGALIAQFTAYDPDSNEYGRVIYSLLNGGNDKFDIDPNNGTLRARVALDREEQDRYTLVIQASDNPSTDTEENGGQGHRLTDSLLVKIRVLDENDNRPECEQDKYFIEIGQNADVGTILTQVKGIDVDAGRNAQLRYFIHSAAAQSTTSSNRSDSTILNEMLSINPLNGQIRTRKRLNEYAGLYQFAITLMDNGPAVGGTHHNLNSSNSKELNNHQATQPNLSGSCLLEVLVKEHNMYAPKFLFPNANSSIIRIKSSQLQPGARITTVVALDDDRGPNGLVSYRLDDSRPNNDDWKQFRLNASTGDLFLHTRLNPVQQASYTIDLIAQDHGKPSSLSARFTLVIVLVDDSNNAAYFNRKQVCLRSETAGEIECEKDYQSVVVKFREETNSLNNTVALNLAQMSDPTRNASDICYYLMGVDRQYFKMGKKSGVLMPRAKLDREKRDKYEVIVKASEHCLCAADQESSQSETVSSPCSSLMRVNSFDPNDISQLRVKVLVQDVNDNVPRFAKSFYQIGVTPDVEFGEVILDSFVSDADSTGTLNISIVKHSLVSNTIADSVVSHGDMFPFALKFYEESPRAATNIAKNSSVSSNNKSKNYRFQIKTNVYMKPSKSSGGAEASKLAVGQKGGVVNMNKNILYQFNLSTWDENVTSGGGDQAVVQIIMINRQQRVKLVFSQPIDRVVRFQDEFQAYISNLTGFKAYIDKIYLHKPEDDFDYSTTSLRPSSSMTSSTRKSSSQTTLSHSTSSTKKPIYLTDMLLHFTRPDTKASTNKSNDEDYIINADTILNILDRSVDLELLKKYKLTIAEKYDDQGSSTYYKYGSISADDYVNFFDFGDDDDEGGSPSGGGGGFFSSSSSASGTGSSSSSLLTRLVLLITCFLLSFLLISTVIVFYCMKKTYKRKLRAERAMVKAFGLEHNSMMTTYNDSGQMMGNGGAPAVPATVGGYLNMAFDSNSLLPIPGTNLYAYEGSNPMWLKKYEKVDSKNNTSASVTSSSLPSSSSSSGDSAGRREKKYKIQQHSDKKSPTSSSSNNNNNKNRSSGDDDITSFYLKQIDSTLESSSPLKLVDVKLADVMGKHHSVIDELSAINFLGDQHNNNNNNNNNRTTSPPTSNHLSSFQRETLLTFATDDTLINNAITAAINNSNQTMKSFKKPSETIIDGFRDDSANKKKFPAAVDKKLATTATEIGNAQNYLRPTNSNQSGSGGGVFLKSSNFTKIFDSCAGSNCSAANAATLLNRLNAKEENVLLINQPVSKDVCDLFAVESTVI